MIPFIIAVIILVILSVFFMGLRAYMSFSLLMMGACSLIAGLGGEEVLFYLGAAGVVFALTAAYLTVRGAERSQIPTQMVRFFIYGLLIFVRVCMIAMIITIPLAAFFGTMAKNYREMIVVDCFGNRIGKAYVDDNLRDPEGNQYDRPY